MTSLIGVGVVWVPVLVALDHVLLVLDLVLVLDLLFVVLDLVVLVVLHLFLVVLEGQVVWLAQQGVCPLDVVLVQVVFYLPWLLMYVH